MKLLSYTRDGQAGFGAVLADGVVDLGARLGPATTTLRELIEQNGIDDARRQVEAAGQADFPLAGLQLAPTVPDPGKIVCIGINYGNRDAEYKEAAGPAHPSVFFRTPESLAGHEQPILRPPESEQLDYEGEIVCVIGHYGRRITEERALEHIAGFTIMNEGSIRDWLRHAKFNVTPGKNFVHSGGLGPWMVTADEVADVTRMHVSTRVNGEIRQDDTTDNLIFPFRKLIAYVSTFMPLNPGDILATGTPTGAGARFTPPKFLKAGDVVEVTVDGIGTLRNKVVDEVL